MRIMDKRPENSTLTGSVKVDYQETMQKSSIERTGFPVRRRHPGRASAPKASLPGGRTAARGNHPPGMARREKEPADKPGSVWDDHSSGMPVTGHLVRPTRRQLRAAGCLGHVSLFGLAPEGVCRAAPVAGDAVRSYRTLSPLPAAGNRPAPSAVCFLLHFPSTRVAQALPGLSPCGARTFLRRRSATAIVWPAPVSTLCQARDAGKPAQAPESSSAR